MKKIAQIGLIRYRDLRIWARAAVSADLVAMGAVFTDQEDLLLPLMMSTTKYQTSITTIGDDVQGQGPMPRMIRWTMRFIVPPQDGQLEGRVPSRTKTMSMGEEFWLEDRGASQVQPRIAKQRRGERLWTRCDLVAS
ncbi:Ff.00g119010.m01.CDS01 [Fusarium sp. VM40]|nr:Ff.00g119010.m01.CDS01 [Fusarium sp. VM40]